MASEQFILEMHKKLHPGSDAHSIEGMTGAALVRINEIIDDKHSIRLGSKWISDRVTVDLKVLRNMMTSATLNCQDGLKKLNSQAVSDMSDGSGRIDPDMVTKWEDEVAYYQDQLDAVKVVEQLLETLRAATNKEGFYMQGVTTP